MNSTERDNMLKAFGAKYYIGDKVHLLRKRNIFESEVECPICHGDPFAFNPNYKVKGAPNQNEWLECGCCNGMGTIPVKSKEVMELSKEIYEIRRICITVGGDDEIKVKYNVAEIKPEGGVHVTNCFFRTEDCFVPHKE